MPTQLTEEEFELNLPSSQRLATHEHGSVDKDDYIMAELRKSADGRHWRYIESSGMDSIYHGAGQFGEWLSEDKVSEWRDFK